jgi:alanine dehydrogenase
LTPSRVRSPLFTYLHLAADRRLTEFLLDRRIDSIAYETVQTPDGRLPLLTPMSEVAGRMSVQAAAHHVESSPAGAGLLLGGVPVRRPRRSPSSAVASPEPRPPRWLSGCGRSCEC